MKRGITFLLTAFMLLSGMSLWAQTRAEASIDFSQQGYANAQDLDGVVIEIDDNVSIVFNKNTGNNGPKYYNTGTAIRAYAGNNFVVSSTGTISAISLTFGSGDGSNALTTDVGDFNSPDWAGSSSEVTFTVGGTSGHRRIKAISVTYSSGGQQQTVATPTFNPVGDTYYEAQSVSIACATEGASIYYTLDGSTPDESSTLYASPISISETTTVKAIGKKEGYLNSSVATAEYIIVEAPGVITIAEAKALANNAFAMVQGVVTFIDGRNVYVQDETGGICLYLNNNTVPSALALGDLVQGYGQKTVYKGLIELQNINGSNASEFSILSSGNALPLAVKTIAEVLEGSTDALQSTRVKVEAATIGAINTSSNTPLTQGESTINIYKVPALTGITEGDIVDVIAVVGYYNAPQLRVAYAEDVVLNEPPVVPDPTLTVSVSELGDFRYTYGNGPSSVKNFTISGSDLTDGVTLTAPEHFELSLSPDNGYFDSDELSPVGGIIAETTIYVRMKAGLAVGTYTGNITVVSGSLNYTIALNGMVDALPVAATPTFSPIGGTYLTSVEVTINCETEGATIHYTIDGTDPTESSAVYNSPITVSTTTTIKAIAVVSGYENSSVAEALYTINEPMTIAEARALDDNQYACVEGIVTFITGRNLYIQDATAGIDLYLNSNTVPSNLALGDNVRAYGKKTTYNGLVELTGIAGNNANVFSILSSGNSLPLAIKTIAEINNDFNGNNLLQATRVKIENAIIGAINPSGTTVISQEGNMLNVYHIPTIEGMIQGDWVTITGVISCYNTPQLLVASADDIQFSHRPTLTANPTSLSGFTYVFEDGGPSEIQSFLVSGNQLLGNVSVFPSENFEVSTFSGEGFRPEDPAMIYIPYSGHFYDIAIYVRLKSDLEIGTYSEDINVISQDADTLHVHVTGTVTSGATPPPTPTGDYVRISSLDGLTAGSQVVFAARFDGTATDYYAMSNQSLGKPTGVLFTSATSGSDEILPASIVDEESSYYWTVGVTNNGYTFTNANNELIGYSSGTNFATDGDNTEWGITIQTSEESAMVPNYTGFVIANVNNPVRAFALNSSHNFGPYHTQNLAGANYNFFLDIFVKTEGGVPPTPTVATPTFTPAAGTYYESQTVSIACATDGATIYYSTASENGPWNEYETAITVDENMTLWAYAEKEGYNNSNVAEATYIIQLGFVTIFNQDWEGEMNGWTFVDVEGEASWSVANYQGNHYAYANGYNHGANIDWCISPAFNLDAYDNPTLSFRTAKNYTGNDLEVFFSNNYDGTNPVNSIWTALSCNLSTGGYIWTESGDIDLSSFSGSNCYIGFMYTCEEGSAAAWELDDILLIGQTSEPVVTVTPLTLNGFTYIEGNGPSTEQGFTVSGLNLSGNITITEATDFEISLTSGNNFNAQSAITLAPINGNVEETTVYVRMKAGLTVGDYEDEDITITCVDVEDIDVTCSGTVTEQPVPGDDYVRISDVSELAAGNRVILAARYNGTEDAYLAIANTLTSGKFATTEFTSAMNGSDEIIPAEILLTEDDYYWTVDVTSDGYTFTNANGQVLSYGSGTNFNFTGTNTVWIIDTGISDTASMVPEYFGFNIANFTNSTRAFAIRYYNEAYICGAYSTSNLTNGEYNFFLDIFMQGEGGVPPTPTVAAPIFTPAGGTYYEAQEVTISCATEGATIWYSLIPDPYYWQEYDGTSLTIDENMTIWAYATKDDYNDSPVVSAEYIIQDDLVIIFNQDWEDDWNGWTQVSVEGDEAEWNIAEHNGNHYAYMNGYNHGENEDWLFSPAFDLDSYSDVVLTFVTAKNYTGDNLEVLFSNDYDGQDPLAATWETLECELSQGSWNWTPSGDISLDEFSGSNCYIAFRYTCSEDEAAAWEVDDIMLTSGGGTAIPTLIATPNSLNGFSYVVGNGPSASQSYTLTGANLEGEGNITVTAGEYFEISLDDEEFVEELAIPFADGVITDQPVTIYVRMVEGLEADYYADTISHEGGNATTMVNVAGTVHGEDEPIMSSMMPLFIQGNNGSNNNRIPVAAPVIFNNLEPNTTYRYTNQFVDGNDGPETAGAGNVIYASLEGFYRSTSPSLATEGGYGEFTTNEVGSAIVWLMNEPTANARFTPGNHVFIRVRINDGNDGTTVNQIFTSENYATVLNFGNENDEYSGSAFYVKSNEAPMNFALMYNDLEAERPVCIASIETIGVDYGSINQYADFYKELVAGNDGWFGGILPNDNETGITYILTTSMDVQTFHQYYSEDGHWSPDANTVNPTNGLDEPIFIDLTDDGVDDLVTTNVKVWSADHEFVIENGDNCRYAMQVVNVLGQIMMTQEIAAGSTVRISHNLTSGIYIISLQNNQNKIAAKVMVK